MKPIGAAILLAVIVGFAAFFYFSVKSDESVLTNVDAAGRTACPDHWHNGFDVYTQSASGQPQKIDFRAPSWPNTALHYYEWNNGDHFRAPGMTIATHAHMSGAEGSGSTNQLHYEKPGTCVGLADAIRALDVHIDAFPDVNPQFRNAAFLHAADVVRIGDDKLGAPERMIHPGAAQLVDMHA